MAKISTVSCLQSYFCLHPVTRGTSQLNGWRQVWTSNNTGFFKRLVCPWSHLMLHIGILEKNNLMVDQCWHPHTVMFSECFYIHQAPTVRWECQGRTGCWRTPICLGTLGWTMILTTGIVSSLCSTPTIGWVTWPCTCPKLISLFEFKHKFTLEWILNLNLIGHRIND